MDETTSAWALMILGLFIVTLSLAADVLGLGAQPAAIGWKQWLGAAVGLALIGLGWWRRQVGQSSEVDI